MIKRVNLLVLQAVADKLPPRTKEIVEDAIREICEWRDAMRKINATALDALSERPADRRLERYRAFREAPKEAPMTGEPIMLIRLPHTNAETY